MLKNFLKTALRSIVKNKLISFINIFGLSVAIGCSLVVYIYVDWELSMDKYHVNHEKIFLLQNIVSRDGEEQRWGDSPAPIGEMLKDDFPQIIEMVRVDNRSAVGKYGDKVFKERVRFVDPAFLKMFSFPLESGNNEVLSDPTKLVISKRMAEKYFGEENPLGKQFELILNNKKESFEIAAVGGKFPKTSSFTYDFLINFERKFNIYDKDDPEDWKDFINATFIQLENPSDIDYISDSMDKYIKLQNAADEDWPASAYTFHPLTTLSLNSYKINGDISGGGDPVGRIVLSMIGIFMMLLACFNYINISIVSATKRLKEIGIRKVIGGTKRQLVFQFIGENLIVCLFALILGSLLARFLFGPWFDNLFSIGLSLELYQNPKAWLFFFVLLMITGLGSGAYPAFYVSSFNAVSIFRGKQRFGTKNKFTKVFLVFQFVLSIITIVFGITFVQNANYQQERDWGYNQEQVLVIPIDKEQTYTVLKNEFIQNPNIASIAGSKNHIGRFVNTEVIDLNGKKNEIRRIDVGYDYLETLGVRLKKGRFFERSRGSDTEESVIINEKFAKNMEWEQPLGKIFDIDSLSFNVVGVTENFHYDDFDDQIEPAFFKVAKPEDFNFISLKVKAGKANNTTEIAARVWKENVPDLPYTGFFQDTVFDNYFTNVKGHGKIMGFTATLAIILSCMGLFGLVSLNVNARMREFSIRKVLGAEILHIFNGVNRQYIWLILIACFLGLPISYYFVNMLLEEVYAYHMPLTAGPLILATVFIFGVSLLTVSSLIYKVIVANPVDSLRSE